MKNVKRLFSVIFMAAIMLLSLTQAAFAADDKVAELEKEALSNWIKPVEARILEIKNGRQFGAKRDDGARAHAGIDYYVKKGDGTPVYAMQSGEVIEYIEKFYKGTSAVAVKHADGSVARYCEISTSLKKGDKVKQGQVIAKIKANTDGGTMLHLEIYLGTKSGSLHNSKNKTYDYVAKKTYNRRADLIDPSFTLEITRTHEDLQAGNSAGGTSANQQKVKLLVKTDKTLKKGSKGIQVEYLQDNLTVLGYSCGDADGTFGDKTKTAVAKFQKNFSLESTGEADTKTLEKIKSLAVQIQKDMYKMEYYKGVVNATLCSDTTTVLNSFKKAYVKSDNANLLIKTDKTLKKGSKGAQVKYLQTNLNTLGYSCGKVDSAYGDNTKEAVAKFQKSYGLDSTGIADAKTLEKIKSVATEVQIALSKSGYYSGEIDGVMGSSTVKALKNVQKANGRAQTGVVNKYTRNLLLIELLNVIANK